MPVGAAKWRPTLNLVSVLDGGFMSNFAKLALVEMTRAICFAISVMFHLPIPSSTSPRLVLDGVQQGIGAVFLLAFLLLSLFATRMSFRWVAVTMVLYVGVLELALWGVLPLYGIASTDTVLR